MIRPLTIATFLLACGSGLYLYQSKHEAQVLDRTIEKTIHETAAYREQSRLLAAEWTMLNDPESLRRFANAYLTLKTITPSQFTSLTDLDNRLPPVQVPDAARSPEEAVPTLDAPNPDAAPPVRPISEDATAIIAAQDVRGQPRPVVPPVATAVAVSTRPPERKGTAPRLAATDATYKAAIAESDVRSANVEAVGRRSATDAAPPVRAVTSAESRSAEQRANEQHPAERHGPQSTDRSMAETRGVEVHPAVALPQPRPMVVTAAVRHPQTNTAPERPAATNLVAANLMRSDTTATDRQPIRTPAPAQPRMPYGGSLLGMAREPASSPLPRPTPVSTIP